LRGGVRVEVGVGAGARVTEPDEPTAIFEEKRWACRRDERLLPVAGALGEVGMLDQRRGNDPPVGGALRGEVQRRDGGAITRAGGPQLRRGAHPATSACASPFPSALRAQRCCTPPTRT